MIALPRADISSRAWVTSSSEALPPPETAAIPSPTSAGVFGIARGPYPVRGGHLGPPKIAAVGHHEVVGRPARLEQAGDQRLTHHTGADHGQPGHRRPASISA